MSTPIPSPPSLPLLGHITHLEKEVPLRSYVLLADQYGEIYQLNLLGENIIFICSYELQNEISNDQRFQKTVVGSLYETRNALGDGLFTAFRHEENWGIAHRLLMPAFSTAKVRDMFDDMNDIASQMITKWERIQVMDYRFGPRHKIEPSDDFTKLAFDTITLCAMSYRLNSFYKDTPHAFLQAMADFLLESGYRSKRPGILTSIMRTSSTKYKQDMDTMNNLVDELIKERKTNPTAKQDLLNIMLNSVDTKTGKRLTDENIRHNLLTFLVAGHETTSGLLTFTLYYLCKNADAMHRIRKEIDEVLGEEPIRPEHISKLKYTSACLRESLRLSPPATMRPVESLEDTTIGGGKYRIAKGAGLVIISCKTQTDPKVWGEDAREFKPERCYGENFEKLPQNSWQPFGYGMRACIGRPLSWQESHIVLACIIQKFDIVMDDPTYTLELKQTLTIKPKNFYIHALPRNRSTSPIAVAPSSSLVGLPQVSEPSTVTQAQTLPLKHKMYVVYGSNTGTSQTFAQRIASGGAAHGFKSTLGTLDSIVEHVPSDGPLVIVTASFEGEPADNAAHFFKWMKGLEGEEFKGVKYAVFGCGNRDWVRTFQRVPKVIDDTFSERGGQRLLERGIGDVQEADFFECFDKWEAELWKALAVEYGVALPQGPALVGGITMRTVDVGTSRASDLRQGDADLGKVMENRVLTSPNAPQKRHIEIELPEHMTYRAGDYLAVLPVNPTQDIHRVTARFGVSPEQQIVLNSVGPTSLPVDKPITVSSLLSGYVELSQPATTRDLRALASLPSSDSTKAALEDLVASHVSNVLSKRISILDILEKYPDINLPFSAFLEMLPAMRVRQYSISSSPLHNSQRPSLTISVVSAPALSGRAEPFLGVASTFLAGLHPGDVVQVAVRASATAFHPPEDLLVPMVMFAAGSGLSPMRGFLQERAVQKKAGRPVAKSLLFFGCRSPREDYLYAETDLKEWEELGVVDLRPAFSRSPEDSLGCKYVQDRVWHDRAEVRDLFDNHNGKFFACGSGKVAQGVKQMLTAIIKEAHNLTDEAAAAAFERAIQGRYATDIFE